MSAESKSPAPSIPMREGVGAAQGRCVYPKCDCEVSRYPECADFIFAVQTELDDAALTQEKDSPR